MEIKDIATIVSSIASFINAIIALERRKKIRLPTNVLFWIAIFFAIFFAALAIWLLMEPYPDTSRYGFESGPMGWTKETVGDSQGVTDVSQSANRAKLGRYSLKLAVDLEGGHPNRSKGEAYVRILPQNMEDKPITLWVFVPGEALGDPQRPNGIQVFAKDEHWKAEYGTWWDITPEKVEGWHRVALTPSKFVPPKGYMTPDFNPTQIQAVGVKIAIGNGSTAKYRGPIYIDTVEGPQ